nr:hypothetical protein [Haladaptatus sp. R4]
MILAIAVLPSSRSRVVSAAFTSMSGLANSMDAVAVSGIPFVTHRSASRRCEPVSYSCPPPDSDGSTRHDPRCEENQFCPM